MGDNVIGAPVGRPLPMRGPAAAPPPAPPPLAPQGDAFAPAAVHPDDAWHAQAARLAAMRPAAPRFHYQSPPLPDLSPAQSWRPGSPGLSGTEANRTINRTYHRLDQDFTRWMGDPPIANWMTFGKYASREAGEQIRNLEDVQRAANGDPVAGLRAAGHMADTDPLIQGAMMGGERLAHHASRTQPALDPAGAIGHTAIGTATDVARTMGVMRHALVEGNTEIYHNIAPAYDAFLRGEADGRGGMRALTEAGYAPGSKKDPQGFVSSAFQRYTQARERGRQAAAATDPADRARLLDERRQLMNDGNLRIGLQEQMTILQRGSIFGHPDMQQALGAIHGTMSLTDANGRHALRPDGANWASFPHRMGFQEAAPGTPGAIPVTDHQGRTTHYVPDPSQRGTIYEYFTNNLDGEPAQNLMRQAPREMDARPATTTGSGLVDVADGLERGDAGQVAGGTLRAAGGLVADPVDSAGIQTQGAGLSHVVAGARRASQGGLVDRTVGAAEALVGAGMYQGGQMARTAASGVRTATGVASSVVQHEVRNFQTGLHVIGGWLGW